MSLEKLIKLNKQIAQLKFAEWESVTSTNIAELLYEEDIEVLTVVFINGSEWEYDNIPPEIYEDLIDAASVGSYFYWNIREFPGLYPATQIA